MEGDAPDPAACSQVGNCRITNLPANLAKGTPIEVTYAFDQNGRIRVSAREPSSAVEATIEIDAPRWADGQSSRLVYRAGKRLQSGVSSRNPSLREPKQSAAMPQTLDVYRDWLGIKEANRPLNHYQLMRLKQFEDDQAKIREHYRKMNSHVRKYAAGDFGKQSQDLLNELSRAMLCLTDTRRKREYDASLGRKDAGEGRRRSLEEILLYSKVVDEAGLAKCALSPTRSAWRLRTRWCSKSWQSQNR